MEYETYETEQTYDDMNGHELDKTKVWILTGCQNKFVKMLFSTQVGWDLCDKSAHILNFVQLIS